MNKPKINIEIKNKLFSADNKVVLSALNLLKDKGNKDYLPLLFDLLLANPQDDIQQEITKLLGTIKDKDTVSVFVEALKETKYSKVRKEILTSCWQNGLDYSPHLEVFVDLVIDSEWEVAFEAFTVIENLEYFPEEEEMKDIKLKIARALKSANEQKSYFLEAILNLAP